MKKYIFIISVLFAALSSCVKDDVAGTGADGYATFSASYSADQTKTVLEGLTPFWTPSDEICIYDGESNRFTNSLTAPSAVAEFKGTLAGKGRQHYLAASPYSPDITFYMLGKTIYGLEVPVEQTATVNSYDPSALASVAYTTTHDLEFQNTGSLIRFKVISEGVESVKVIAGNQEFIAGTFSAACNTPLNLRIKEGVDNVTLKGNFQKDSTYYIVTFPAILNNGFRVVLNGNIQTLQLDIPVELMRSGLVDIGSLSLNPDESQLPEQDEESGEGETPGGSEGEGGEGTGEASGWCVLGSFNSWVPGDFLLYDDGTYLVAKNVKIMNDQAGQGNGFKFNHETYGWKGVSSTTALSVGEWHNLNGENNILLSDNVAYDVYMNKEGSAFCAVAAGTAVPEYSGGGNSGGNPGGEVTDGKVIYLNAGGSSLWDQAGAWFEVWSWADGAEGSWYSMTSAGTGVYQCTIPTGNKNIIFVRRGPDMTTGWDQDVHYWNKTDDLVIPAGSNCYTITGWGGSEGTWSTR